MRDSLRLEFFNSLFDAGNQYSTSPEGGAAEAFFHGTMYTGAFEPPPPPPLFMPPPPPPPPPPQVAHDDCAKKRTRRATAIERKSRVFMVRDYNYGLRQPSSARVCQEFVGNPPLPLGGQSYI